MGRPAELIRAKGLSKRYGYTHALRDVSLTVATGEFWTVFGPNGAGKTTLTGLLATLLKPTSGELFIDGLPAGVDGGAARAAMGVVSHQSFLYDDLTAEENLSFYAGLYGLENARSRIKEVLEQTGLAQRAHHRARHLSRGLHQRLAIARAVLHAPSILLLDEPYAGLDPQASRELGALLRSLHASGTTVVMTSHDLDLGVGQCSHVMILSRGRAVFAGPRPCAGAQEFEQMYFRLVS